ADRGRALAGGRIAGAAGRALGGCTGGAGSSRADVGIGAEVAVAARGPVRRVRVRAGAGGRVARPRHVALVERRTDHRRPGAQASLTAVGAGARVGVVARGPVRLRRVGAEPGRGVAGPRVVALVGRRADDRCAGTGAVRALIGGRADVAVAARRAIRGVRV